jgi:hypothetical protein
VLRVVFGFVIPAALVPVSPGLAALSAVAGDLLDRCEYYDELEIDTPQRQIAAALK